MIMPLIQNYPAMRTDIPFWKADEEYGRKLARVLRKLRETNIQTSVSALANTQPPEYEQLALVL